MQAAKKAFLLETSEATPETLAETLASNVMSGVEPASEMVNMISASDVNVSYDDSYFWIILVFSIIKVYLSG